MRRVEEYDRHIEEIEHTREAYASSADLVRALERSGALRYEEDEPVSPSES
jgi:hypothetical protein